MQISELEETVIAQNRDSGELTWVYVGKAKTEHRTAGISQNEGTEKYELLTLCRKIASGLSDAQVIPYDTDLGEEPTREAKPLGTLCKSCTILAEEIDANEGDHVVWEHSTIEQLDALNADNEETDTMAAKPAPTQTADEIVAEVTKDIKNMIDVLAGYGKADKEKITAVEAQGNAELLKIKAASKRAGLNMEFKVAVAEAKNRPSTAIQRAETTDVESIAGYAEIVDNASNVFAAGIAAEGNAQEAAYAAAEAILDGRIRIFDKKGRPDIKGTRQVSKDLSTAVYEAAEKKIYGAGFTGDQADLDTMSTAFKKKVQYQMTAVVPAFVRALDHSPEQFAELFPALVSEVTDENPASELIFNDLGIDRVSQAEKAKLKRDAKKLEGGSANELESGEGDDENEGEGEGSADKPQFEKDKAKLVKVSKDLDTMVANSKDYTEEQKKEARKLINDTLTALAATLAKLA